MDVGDWDDSVRARLVRVRDDSVRARQVQVRDDSVRTQLVRVLAGAVGSCR